MGIVKKFSEFIDEGYFRQLFDDDINEETKEISERIWNALKYTHFDQYFEGGFNYASLKEMELDWMDNIKDDVDINYRFGAYIVTKGENKNNWNTPLNFKNTIHNIGDSETYETADIERLVVTYNPDDEYEMGDLTICGMFMNYDQEEDMMLVEDKYLLCYYKKKDLWKFFDDNVELSNDELGQKAAELVSIISRAVNTNTKYQKQWFKVRD